MTDKTNSGAPAWRRFYNDHAAALVEPAPFALSQLLDRAAADHGDRPCSTLGDETHSYSDVAAFVEKLAGGLASIGVGLGDRVGFMAPAHPIFSVTTFALWHLGAVGVGLNPLYSVGRLTGQASDSGLKAIVTTDHPDLIAKARSILSGLDEDLALIVASSTSGDPSTPPMLPDEAGIIAMSDLVTRGQVAERAKFDVAIHPAVLQYTGGTTGAPKAAVLTHANLSINAIQMHSWFPYLRPGKESVLSAAPVTHISGVGPIQNFMFHIAGEIVWMPRFDPETALDIIAQKKMTLLLAPPTMFTALLHSADLRGGFDWSSIRNAQCGAAPVPPELKRRFHDLTGLWITTVYGMTETSPAAIYSLATPSLEGTTGIPLPFTEVEIRSTTDPHQRVPDGQQGEIYIRGPQLMPGYWRQPEANAKAFVDGFFRSGDIGIMRPDGAVTVIDRLKDMIIASGYNIYPTDVESALLEHPRIREAAVIGVPCEYRGETVKAIISLRDGESISLDELRQFLDTRLSPMEMPKLLEVVAEIPRNENLKISRNALREREEASSR